jgi:hypothetical protein
MRRVWHTGLCPQPASVAVLKGLWLPELQAWTESWLRMLRRQSAETVEAWQLLRRKELAQAMERERLNSISRFYTGRELQKLLHPRTPAPHSPQLYTNIPGTIVVTGDARCRDAFVAGLPHGYARVKEAHNSTRVVDLSPAHLRMALPLAEETSGSSPHWRSSEILGDGGIWWDILGDLWRFRISLRFSCRHILKKISE